MFLCFCKQTQSFSEECNTWGTQIWCNACEQTQNWLEEKLFCNESKTGDKNNELEGKLFVNAIAIVSTSFSQKYCAP